jgi:hypothetical protein
LDNKSTLTVSSTNDKYADNTSYYEYTLQLKDKYGNPIINKNIAFLKNNCDGFTGCKEIKTNMTNSS